MVLKYIKNTTDNYKNIRQVLFQEFKISNTLCVKLKKEKKIFLNNITTYLDKEINNGDTILVSLDFEEDNSNIVPTKMDLNILYEDDSLLILNKPSNIPVHPSILHFSTSLSNGVKYYFNSINLHRKIRPINRLDKNTSGIVIFAKNEYIHSILSRQMQNKTFKKEYIAICEGFLDEKEGTINKPIARKKDSIIERCIDSSGDESITHYKVLKEFTYNNINLSLLYITLETGRTHQIRVHLSSILHPILGDSLYGNTSNLISRQALHAYKVEFNHPISNEKLIITSNIPEDMFKILA